jgi:hypothetical protein
MEEFNLEQLMKDIKKLQDDMRFALGALYDIRDTFEAPFYDVKAYLNILFRESESIKNKLKEYVKIKKNNHRIP